jgi:hypothetical protein
MPRDQNSATVTDDRLLNVYHTAAVIIPSLG